MLAQADCPRWLRIARSPWSFLLAAAVPAAFAVQAILHANSGTPAVPLDDSYIHFQFGRSFATGHPFTYSPHTSPVPGATSLLWPLLLAIPQLFGVDGTRLIPWAWGLGFLSLGLLAYDTARAAERITSDRVAWLSGVLVLAFSANTWFAASGMEVVPLAWLLMRSVRRAAEWLEGDRKRLGELLCLALAAPLMRPEGALGSLLIAAALAFGGGRTRRFSAIALCFIALPPAIYLLFTGHATQTTTLVKWLPFSPYVTVGGLFATVFSNIGLFLTTLLDGQQWSRAFVPEHAQLFALLALPSLIIAGRTRQREARATLLVVLGLGILLPTTYDSFLWNRLRYLWPFAGPWLIGLVALADQLADFVALSRPRWGAVRYPLIGLCAVSLASKFPFALEDLGESANGISEQQVSLGVWARQNLPAGARIGVNDTGAIAYFSGHSTFDVVGLTTLSEARYWSSGPGSRFEHYEHLKRTELPTHFIVYPGWFGIPDLLGTCLTERTADASILGGRTMVACVADYARLGSGERPSLIAFWKPVPRDALDVADLESEAAHDYTLQPAERGENLVLTNGVVLDGARRNRQRDLFSLDVVPGGRVVARLGADRPTQVTLKALGRVVDSWTVQRPDFEDHALTLPSDLPRGPASLELSSEQGRFSSAHYWSYDAPE